MVIRSLPMIRQQPRQASNLAGLLFGGIAGGVAPLHADIGGAGRATAAVNPWRGSFVLSEQDEEVADARACTR